MELTYNDYLDHADRSICESEIRRIASGVKTLGQFCKSEDGNWEPVYYPGFTMITPAGNSDEANRTTFGLLGRVQEELSSVLNPGNFVTAPAEAFHMTTARLISGDVFKMRSMNIHKDEFLKALGGLFHNTEAYIPLEFAVRGLTVFPQGVVAAVVSPATAFDYKRLQAFRNRVYSDRRLVDFGVERKRGFIGHITLFYIEEALSRQEKENLASALKDTNREHFSEPLPFEISRAEVRKFDDFTQFYRGEHWPVYKFNANYDCAEENEFAGDKLEQRA